AGTAIFGMIAVLLMANTSANSDGIDFLSPALLGIYIVIFGIAIYFEWKKDRNLLNLALFASPLFAFLWIFFTWIATNNIPFFAPHRYVTMSTVWMSIFLGTLLSATFLRLRKKYGLAISLLPFLLLILLFSLDISRTQAYFSNELRIGYG